MLQRSSEGYSIVAEEDYSIQGYSIVVETLLFFFQVFCWIEDTLINGQFLVPKFFLYQFKHFPAISFEVMLVIE